MIYALNSIGIFLSTPSVGRATDAHRNKTGSHAFSIHALRGEGDSKCKIKIFIRYKFLSTPSVGRATYARAHDGRTVKFLSTPSVGRATGHIVSWAVL